jgi:hypothetical protein
VATTRTVIETSPRTNERIAFPATREIRGQRPVPLLLQQAVDSELDREKEEEGGHAGGEVGGGVELFGLGGPVGQIEGPPGDGGILRQGVDEVGGHRRPGDTGGGGHRQLRRGNPGRELFGERGGDLGGSRRVDVSHDLDRGRPVGEDRLFQATRDEEVGVDVIVPDGAIGVGPLVIDLDGEDVLRLGAFEHRGESRGDLGLVVVDQPVVEPETGPCGRRPEYRIEDEGEDQRGEDSQDERRAVPDP